MRKIILATLAALAAAENVFESQDEREGRSLERVNRRSLGHSWHKKSHSKGWSWGKSWGKSKSKSPDNGRPVACRYRSCCVVAEASAILYNDPTATGKEGSTLDTAGYATYSQYGGYEGCGCENDGADKCKGTCIRATVWGLTQGDHGFHVHTYGIGKKVQISF